MKALTKTELDRLLDYLLVTDNVMYAACLSGFRHGMRVSEICDLRRSDIDMLAGTIQVRHLKGSNTVLQALGQDEQAALKITLDRFPTSPYAFANTRGAPFDRDSFYYRFHKACLAVGIPKDKAHPHSLRHALGFRLAEANVSLPIIQAALGHRSPASTFCYANPSADTVNRVMREVIG